MSPVPRPGRHVVLLLGIAVLLTFSLALPAGAQDANATPGATNETPTDAPASGGAGGDLGVPADAPAPADKKITRVLTFGVLDEGCPAGVTAPCFDVATLVANPGDVVVLHGNFVNSDTPHNVHVTEPAGPKSQLVGNAVHTVSFIMPESGGVTFICDAHKDSMIAKVVTPAAAASSGGHASVATLGVHFLAYWVGVIAFAILFIVYGLTFFIFKYNETPATTDHHDRVEGVPESRRLAAVAPLLAVVLAIAAIAAVIFVATR
ncbi:MAG TPA: hypothetical protein VM370_11430 [Candidatus Thermoplasmatota archaeon]|nr:hypothetical protein [Candidatus Thermoplasmatota archaeon]